MILAGHQCTMSDFLELCLSPIQWLLDTEPFNPRLACAGLSPTLATVLITSGSVTWMAYMLLSDNFARVIRVRHHRSTWPVFWFLGAFIFCCGWTHAFGDVAMFFWPVYRLTALTDVLTAMVSLAAAVLTRWYTPWIMGLPRTPDLHANHLEAWHQLRLKLDQIVELEACDLEAARLEARRINEVLAKIGREKGS